jgi:beta-lactamase class A
MLERELSDVAAESDGVVGACARLPDGAVACVNGDLRFSLQSVMKVVVAAAVMDAVDRRGWRLDETVTLGRDDLSLQVQPLARLVQEHGSFTTTLGDLVERAVIQSDSAATDYLYARLGGAPVINAFLQRAGVGDGVRIDRDERHLQTETAGLEWEAAFVDADRLEAARRAVPRDVQRAAFEAYLADPRDTATPRGITLFLSKIADGSLLSAPSTARLLDVMGRTRTFPTRLRAGAPAGWQVAHKTGTSPSFEGLNATTNDVGLLTSPRGEVTAIAVFVARSRQPPERRDAVIASAARAVADHLGSTDGTGQ